MKMSNYVVCNETYGIGKRLLFFCNKEEKEYSEEDIINIVLETDLRKLTFVEPFGQAKEFSELFKKLKEMFPKLNICVYTNMYLDYLYKRNNEYEKELLLYIDTLIDGKPEKNSEFNKEFLYRNSNSQRVIDMKNTNFYNDGYLRLTGNVHLRESYNTKYQFYLWMMAVNDWRSRDIVKYICRFDESMTITNNINKMIDHLNSLGGGKKMLCKFKYLFNRWCHRLDLRIPIHADTGNPTFLDLHPVDEVRYYTSNRMNIYFKELRKHEIDIEKRRFPARPKPQLIHNYTNEEIENRHMLKKIKELEERRRKKETRKRQYKKKEEFFIGRNKNIYKSKKALKILNNRKNKIKNNNINVLLNK